MPFHKNSTISKRTIVPLIKKVIQKTAEYKFKSVFLFNILADNARHIPIYVIDSGSDDDERIGNSIRVSRLSGTIFIQGDDLGSADSVPQLLRVAVCKITAGSTPAFNLNSQLIGNSQAKDAAYQQVFYDKTFQLGSATTWHDGSDTVYDRQMPAGKLIKLNVNFKMQKQNYSSESGNDTSGTEYGLFMYSNKDANSHPLSASNSELGHLRESFKDY